MMDGVKKSAAYCQALYNLDKCAYKEVYPALLKKLTTLRERLGKAEVNIREELVRAKIDSLDPGNPATDWSGGEVAGLIQALVFLIATPAPPVTQATEPECSGHCTPLWSNPACPKHGDLAEIGRLIKDIVIKTPAPDRGRTVLVLREDLKEIIRITDRKAELWDRLKATLNGKEERCLA